MKVDQLTAGALIERGLDPAEAGRIAAKIAGIDPSLSVPERWQEISSAILKPAHRFEVHQHIHKTVFADWNPQSGPIPAWFPGKTDLSNIAWLMRTAGVRTYQDLHAWSIRNRSAFWDTMIKRIDAHFQRPYKSALYEEGGPEEANWLIGAKLNIADSCFNAPDTSPAIVYQREGGAPAQVSVSELRSLVFRVANGLTKAGLGAGDMIAIDMPMTVEACAVFLGAVAAGCVIVAIADSFAPHEIAVRLRMAPVLCIFTQD